MLTATKENHCQHHKAWHLAMFVMIAGAIVLHVPLIRVLSIILFS